MRFTIVDVFAETRLAGNQLAVVRDAAGLEDVAAWRGLHLPVTGEEGQAARQNVDGLVLEIMNVQRRGVVWRADHLHQAERAAGLFGGGLGPARQAQAPEGWTLVGLQEE